MDAVLKTALFLIAALCAVLGLIIYLVLKNKIDMLRAEMTGKIKDLEKTAYSEPVIPAQNLAPQVPAQQQMPLLQPAMHVTASDGSAVTDEVMAVIAAAITAMETDTEAADEQVLQQNNMVSSDKTGADETIQCQAEQGGKPGKAKLNPWIATARYESHKRI